MKVNGDDIRKIYQQQIDKTGFQEKKGVRERKQHSYRAGDKIEISGQLKMVDRLRLKTKNIDNERAERLKQVEKALKEGTYKVDSKRLAYSLLREGLLDKLL